MTGWGCFRPHPHTKDLHLVHRTERLRSTTVLHDSACRSELTDGGE